MKLMMFELTGGGQIYIDVSKVRAMLDGGKKGETAIYLTPRLRFDVKGELHNVLRKMMNGTDCVVVRTE